MREEQERRDGKRRELKETMMEDVHTDMCTMGQDERELESMEQLDS